MTFTLNRDSNSVTIANFWENHLLGKYNYSPAYQRNSIWTPEKQSFFIDSLMRNFPIPPIFLHQKIDVETGKTKYDVIDGKQRLNAIISFLNNEIPVSTETDSDEAEPSPLAGAYFSAFEQPELRELKMRFWRYSLPIEYIDTQEQNVINKIFDRLNRNGERLEGQELRHAKYYERPLMLTVKRLSDHQFWRPKLNALEVSRMEDHEFVSELLFVLLENGPQEADQGLIDEMYEKYGNPGTDFTETVRKFEAVTDFLQSLNIDYDGYKVKGPSHLYGLWCLAWYGVSANIDPSTIEASVKRLFHSLRSGTRGNQNAEEYRKSMSFNTRSRAQRRRRLQALKSECGI